MEAKKVNIITAEGCEHCEEIKVVKGENIQFIDINSEDARRFIPEPSTEELVPTAFDEEGEQCELTIEDGTLVAKCKKYTVIENSEDSIVLNEGDEVVVEAIEGDEVKEAVAA
jgi:hypothetical protein